MVVVVIIITIIDNIIEYFVFHKILEYVYFDACLYM